MSDLTLLATSQEYNSNPDIELIKLYFNQYGDCFIETEALRQEAMDTSEESLNAAGNIYTYIKDGFYEVPGSIIQDRYTSFMEE